MSRAGQNGPGHFIPRSQEQHADRYEIRGRDHARKSSRALSSPPCICDKTDGRPLAARLFSPLAITRTTPESLEETFRDVTEINLNNTSGSVAARRYSRREDGAPRKWKG